MFFVIRGIECLWVLEGFEVIGPFESLMWAQVYLVQTGYTPYPWNIPLGKYDPLTWTKDIACTHEKGTCSKYGYEMQWCGSGECTYCGEAIQARCSCDQGECPQCNDGLQYVANIVEAKLRSSALVKFHASVPVFTILRGTRHFGVVLREPHLIGFFNSTDPAKAYLLKRGYIESNETWLLSSPGPRQLWNVAWVKEIQPPAWVPPLHPELVMAPFTSHFDP